MFRLILFLSSMSFAQQSKTLPLPNLKSEQAQQALQGIINNLFSVFGGTVTGPVVISSGDLTISQGCIFFNDGTSLCTATVGSLGGNNLWTGTNAYTKNTFYHNNWLSAGGISGTQIDTTTTGGLMVLSVDGVAQSSGCVGAITWDSTRNQYVWTSTTTDFSGLNGAMVGVTFESCSPSAICKIITHGPVIVKQLLDCVGSVTTCAITTSTSRCQSSNNQKDSATSPCAQNICNGFQMSSRVNTFTNYMMIGP